MFRDENSKMFWHAFRQALLMMVDAIERGLGITPTTADIRTLYKTGRLQTTRKV